MNLQNIPREQIYRDPFCVSDQNYKIISADFSGQEMRLLVQLSQEPKLIQALKDNVDLHCFSASLIYNIPLKDFFDEKGNVKKELKQFRTNAKSVNFGK